MDIADRMKKASSSIAVPVGMPDPNLKLCDVIAALRRAPRRFRHFRTAEEQTNFTKVSVKLRRYCL